MKSFDPIDAAHAKGASQASRNAGKKFAKVADVPPTSPGSTPTEDLDRITLAIENQKRIAREQINLLVAAIKKGRLILRFPRYNK